MKHAAWLVGLLLSLGVLPPRGLGAYLDGDGTVERQSAGPAIRPPPGRPAPGPETGYALQALVRRLEVGSPVQRRHLTVFPLLLRGGWWVRRGVVTLDEALGQGAVLIREIGEGQVAEVLVRNEAQRPLFLLAGEHLVGGRQNRIVRDDVLLPARSDFVAVSVYCGEQDRWQGPVVDFKSGGTLSAPGLRRLAAGAESQDRIWREIDGQLAEARVAAPTRSYQQLYEDAGVRRELDRCVAEFSSVCRADTVGCLVASGARVRGCEVFSDPELFARLWPKLCRSYAMELAIQGARPPEAVPFRHDDSEPRMAPRPDPRAFLADACLARFTPRPTPGLGRLWQLDGPVSGSALEEGGGLVHASLFESSFVPVRELLRER